MDICGAPRLLGRLMHAHTISTRPLFPSPRPGYEAKDLLAPFVEEPLSEVGSVHSANHTITDDQSEKGSNTVVYKLPSRQEGGADTPLPRPGRRP